MAERSARKLRTLIVDDEEPGRRMLHSLLASDRDIDAIHEARSAMEAHRRITVERPDLIFIDFMALDAGNMELMRNMEVRPYVILVTAHSELALQAFDLQADDFLLKPVLRQRFVKSMIRAKRRISERKVAGLLLQIAIAAEAMYRDPMGLDVVPSPVYPTHIMFRVRRRMFSLDVNDISWIEGASQYSRVYTRQGEHLLSRTLGSLECELDPEQFLRVHRSAIVNARCVSEVRSSGDGRYYIYLHGGKALRVGRSRHAVLAILSASYSRGSGRTSDSQEGTKREIEQQASVNGS